VPTPPRPRSFPAGFLFGTKSSAYQVEGSIDAGGRGRSIWDTFSHTPGATRNGDTGDVTADHYRHLDEDLDLVVELGTPGFCFSVAWPRVQPEGSGPANQAGLDCVLDDQQLVGRPSQTALTDAGTPQLLAIAGNPADSWLYVRVAQGLGGVQGGMPPLTMAGYPTIPRPTASDLSVLYGWLLACFPGADGGGYVVGGGSYAPAPGSDDAGVEAGEGEGGGGD